MGERFGHAKVAKVRVPDGSLISRCASEGRPKPQMFHPPGCFFKQRFSLNLVAWPMDQVVRCCLKRFANHSKPPKKFCLELQRTA